MKTGSRPSGDRPGSDRRRKVGGGLNGQRGFTILEIMIALAIIAMLVAVAMSNLHENFRRSSEVKVAKLFVTTEVEIPLTSYRIDMGDFPTAEDGGLKALWVAPANKTDRWHGPYAKSAASRPARPVGQRLQVRLSGRATNKGVEVRPLVAGARAASMAWTQQYRQLVMTGRGGPEVDPPPGFRSPALLAEAPSPKADRHPARNPARGRIDPGLAHDRDHDWILQ